MERFDDRIAAWYALHDPMTDAASLAAIAQRHPEFAEAIARHPNCYDGLRAWLATVGTAPAPAPEAAVRRPPREATVVQPPRAAAPRLATAPVAQPPASAPARGPRSRTALVAALAAGVLVLGGGGAWAVAALWGGRSPAPTTPSGAGPVGEATPSPASTRTLAGPPVYIGDELDWFLPPQDQLAAFFPGADGFETDAFYGTTGESEGVHTRPEACSPWVIGDDWSIVGSRTVTWDAPGPGDDAVGRVQVLQLPDGAHAEDHYRAYADTVAACSSFDMLLYDDTVYASLTLESLAGGSDSNAMVVGVTSTESWSPRQTRVLALEGNVVVSISVQRPDGAELDADGLREMVDGMLDQARQRLTEEIGYR